LIPTIEILNSSISSKYSRNVTVSRLFEELFLENWTISIDYDRYYASCAPKICIYSYTKRSDFGYMITMLISLYGGLQSILVFFIPRIVKYFMKRRFNNTRNVTTIQISLRSKFDNWIKRLSRTNILCSICLERISQRFVICFGILKKNLLSSNLFPSIDRSPEAIHHQRLSTRIFLCLLFG